MSCGVPGVRVRTDGRDAWPGTIESDEGTTLCFVESPEVLADPADVDDLAAGVQLDEAELPLWLVTVKPAGASEQADAAMKALATGLVARCGGWAFAGSRVVASGPDAAELLEPDEPPLSFVAVTPDEPTSELLTKVRDRHVVATPPLRIDTLDELASYVRPDETDGHRPPLWVTRLTADASCRASTTLALAVAAAEFVMTADADVFDDDGKRLPLPHTGFAD